MMRSTVTDGWRRQCDHAERQKLDWPEPGDEVVKDWEASPSLRRQELSRLVREFRKCREHGASLSFPPGWQRLEYWQDQMKTFAEGPKKGPSRPSRANSSAGGQTFRLLHDVTASCTLTTISVTYDIAVAEILAANTEGVGRRRGVVAEIPRNFAHDRKLKDLPDITHVALNTALPAGAALDELEESVRIARESRMELPVNEVFIRVGAFVHPF
jgi:hypothetical protein